MGRLIAWLLGLWAPCKPREQRGDLPQGRAVFEQPTADMQPRVAPWKPPVLPASAVTEFPRDAYYGGVIERSGVYRRPW